MYWCYLCCSYICWCWLRRVFSENSTGREPIRCFISLLRESRGADTTLVLVSVISSFFSSREYTRRMIQNRQAKKDRFWTASQKLDTLPTLGGAVFYGKIFRWIPTCRRSILFGREQQTIFLFPIHWYADGWQNTDYTERVASNVESIRQNIRSNTNLRQSAWWRGRECPKKLPQTNWICPTAPSCCNGCASTIWMVLTV